MEHIPVFGDTYFFLNGRNAFFDGIAIVDMDMPCGFILILVYFNNLSRSSLMPLPLDLWWHKRYIPISLPKCIRRGGRRFFASQSYMFNATTTLISISMSWVVR